MSSRPKHSRLALLSGIAAALAVLAVPAPRAQALRGNIRRDLARLEQMGHYEQVLFYRRSTADMVTALHAAWSGAPYDRRMDGVYPMLDRIYGSGRRTRHQMVETRVDRRYWGSVHSQRQPITRLLVKANLTPAQIRALDGRVRVYVEDHLAPEFDEMGNFFFRAKARIFEGTGLFWDASFRRRLLGYYDARVCAPYYATMADELERQGEAPRAAAYRRQAAWYRGQALLEFRRSNGDRLLSKLQGRQTRRRFTRQEVLGVLKSGLASKEPDTRLAAAMNLGDLGETGLLLTLATDRDVEVRRAVARAFAENVSDRGLAVVVKDVDPTVRGVAQAALRPRSAAGLRRGIRAEYFKRPDQGAPAAKKVLRRVDLGFIGNERFPDVLRRHWRRESIFPQNARGQFRLKLRGKLHIPSDGRYRFYVKTDGSGRAVVRLNGRTIISPANDRRLLYVDQVMWRGGTLHRIDFCLPLDLAKGLADIEIDYTGRQVRHRHGVAGIRLYWSSSAHVMTRVPPAAFFHKGE